MDPSVRPWDRIASHHIQSYNHFVSPSGLRELVDDIWPDEFLLRFPWSETDGVKVKVEVTKLDAEVPKAKSGSSGTISFKTSSRLMPALCREAALDYTAAMSCTIDVTCHEFVAGNVAGTSRQSSSIHKNLGQFPVMVRSKLCHLHGLGEAELLAQREEPSEFGGYFISKGHEKLFRSVIVRRRNYPLALDQAANAKQRAGFTSKAVYIRSVKGSHVTTPVTLHYVTDGSIVLRGRYSEKAYELPAGLLLRALTDKSDAEISRAVTYGHEGRPHPQDPELQRYKAEYDRYTSLLKKMISCAMQTNQRMSPGSKMTRKMALDMIGHRYRRQTDLPEWYSNMEVARLFLSRCMFIHLESDEDKFQLLVYSMQKLVAFHVGLIGPDNPDSLIFQELTTPGHVLGHFMKEKLELLLKRARELVFKEFDKAAKADKTSPGPSKSATKAKTSKAQSNEEFVKKVLTSCTKYLSQDDSIWKDFSHLFSTGNLRGTRGRLGLAQTNGLVVAAERINMLRYISHFRVVHRGSFFADSRSSDPRKFRPENYGFVCPTHTPDGKLCGILNHLTRTATVISGLSVQARLMLRLGVAKALHDAGVLIDVQTRYLHAQQDVPLLLVLMDGGFLRLVEAFCSGTVLGHVAASDAIEAEKVVRDLKFDSDIAGADTLEVVLVMDDNMLRQVAPGLFIFSENCRISRPVRNLERDATEWIGSMEQDRLHIACFTRGANRILRKRCNYTHQEIRPDSILETVAALSPFSDHNHGCRNIYQVQMAKQTMGVPGYTIPYRTEQKSYILDCMQSPITRSYVFDEAEIGRYPLGFNAMVAVLCYTGYDMEDAMVINKMSFERGFGFGHVLKTLEIDILDQWVKQARFSTFVSQERQALHCPLYFARDKSNPKLEEFLDLDGLPYVGKMYRKSDPFYCYLDGDSGQYILMKYKYEEAGYVENVRICGIDSRGHETNRLNRVMINMWFPRRPQPGDKFASRHGQKGILSFLYPSVDLPFTDAGMTPDIIFNPHGFPSRMTVGKFIEAMAGKVGCAAGLGRIEAAPFSYGDSEKPPMKLFGEKLTELGYNYYGRETMYSGVNGMPLEYDVFYGPIFYQRLRHMVEDKFQVRSTGDVEPKTRQPVHGRARGGGVRFGEMERDTVISHGAGYVLQDRLMDSSDADVMWACAECGDLFPAYDRNPDNVSFGLRWQCRLCTRDDRMAIVRVPYVLRVLAAELFTLGVRLRFDIKTQKICMGHGLRESKLHPRLESREK